MQRSALCRSRRELSNEYLLAKFGFDTAENEPCKVCPLSAYRSPRLPPAWSHESAFYPTQASFDAGGAGVYEYVMDIMEDPAVQAVQ